MRTRIAEYARDSNGRPFDESAIKIRYLNNILVARKRVDASIYERLFSTTKVSVDNLTLVPMGLRNSVNIPYASLPVPASYKYVIAAVFAVIAGSFVMPEGTFVQHQLTISMWVIYMCLIMMGLGTHSLVESRLRRRSVNHILRMERVSSSMIMQFLVFQLAGFRCEWGNCELPSSTYIVFLLSAVLAAVMSNFRTLPQLIAFLTLLTAIHLYA